VISFSTIFCASNQDDYFAISRPAHNFRGSGNNPGYPVFQAIEFDCLFCWLFDIPVFYSKISVGCHFWHLVEITVCNVDIFSFSSILILPGR